MTASVPWRPRSAGAQGARGESLWLRLRRGSPPHRGGRFGGVVGADRAGRCGWEHGSVCFVLMLHRMSLPNTLVIIETDPRTSPRPAEGDSHRRGHRRLEKDGRDAASARSAQATASRNTPTNWSMKIILPVTCRSWPNRPARFTWRIPLPIWTRWKDSAFHYEKISPTRNGGVDPRQRLPDPFMSENFLTAPHPASGR